MNQRRTDDQLILDRLAEEGIAFEGDLYTLIRRPAELGRVGAILLQLMDRVQSPASRIHLARVAAHARLPPALLLSKLRELRPAIEAGDEPLTSVAWALGEALRTAADSSVFSELVEILRDRRFGRARQMLPYALVRIRAHREEATRCLVEVIDDPDLTVQVIDALGKANAREAAEVARPYLSSGNRYVKTAARRALQRMAKADDSEGQRAGSQSPRPQPVSGEGLHEVSCNLDLEQAPAVLERISAIASGFNPEDVRRLLERLDAMESGDEETYEFTVVYEARSMPLLVRLLMSDVDSPDVAFFSERNLAGAIEECIEEVL